MEKSRASWSMRLKLIFVFFAITGCYESKEVRLQKFLLKGNLAFKEQNLDQAAYYFREALRLEPCFADAPITWERCISSTSLGTCFGAI